MKQVMKHTEVIFVNEKGEPVLMEGTLKEFCAKHKLNASAMRKIISGKQVTHKGWTLYE